MDYKDKYFKYKNKYLNLKNLVGGALEDVISFKANLRINPDKFQIFSQYSDHIISAGKISEILNENYAKKFINLEFKIKYATIKKIYKIFITYNNNEIETDLILSEKNTTSIDWFEKLGRTQYSSLIYNGGLDIFNDENAELFDKSTNELRKILNRENYNYDDNIKNFIKKLQNDNTFLFLTPNYLLKYFNITNEIKNLEKEKNICETFGNDKEVADIIINNFYNKIQKSEEDEKVSYILNYNEYYKNRKGSTAMNVQVLESNNQIDKIFEDIINEEEQLQKKKIDNLDLDENDKNKLNKLILDNLGIIKIDITEDLIKNKMKEEKSFEEYEEDLKKEKGDKLRIMAIKKINLRGDEIKFDIIQGLRDKKRIEDYNSKYNDKQYMEKLNEDLKKAKDVLNDLETNQKNHINEEFKISKNKNILISTETTKNLKKEEKEYNLIILPLFNLTDIKINDKFRLEEDFNIKNLLNYLTEKPSE